MATPTYAQVISQINTFIVTNHNNEITAAVLNPILVLLTDFTNNTIGDLNTLTTDEKNTIVAAINSLKNNLTNIVNNGVQLYTGMGDPNVTPPPTYKPADFYLQIDFDSLPVQLWQFDGFTWVADGGGSSNWGLIFGDIHDQADLMAELNLRELFANKQNSMDYDGFGIKYPTVDAVNLQANNIYRAVVATGFLDTTDSFLLSRVDDFTLGVAASQFGIAFSQYFKVSPYAPSAGIFQLTARNIPLSAIGLVGTGTAIKFVGYRASDDSILFSDTQFIQSPSVAQLGIVLVKYSGGVTSFIDATRTTITIPDIAAYSNLDTSTTGLRATTSIAAIAGTLSHSNTLGSLVGISVAWHTSNNDSKVIPALNPTTFTRLSPANALTVVPPTVFNTLDPTQYWNGTALIAIAGGAGVSSVQRLLFTVNGNFVWQYGEATYPNLVAAQNNILQAIFTNILPIGTFAEVGRMAITKGCTDLNSANAQYYPTGSTGGGGTSPVSPTAWGFITGSIDDQLDLKAKLDLKELLANKATTLVGNETSDIKYPTTKLLFDNLALKQNVITNPITGTGTVNTVPKFGTATGLVNSSITDSGTGVGGIVNINNFIGGNFTKVLPTGNTATGQTFNLTGTDATSRYRPSTTVNMNEDGISTQFLDVGNENLSVNKTTNQSSLVANVKVLQFAQNNTGSLFTVNAQSLSLAGSGTGVISNFNGYLGNKDSSLNSYTVTNFATFNTGNGLQNVVNGWGLKINEIYGTSSARGIDSNVSSGVGKYNAFFQGTADNYFNGDVKIGTLASLASKLVVGGTINAAAAIARGQLVNSTLVATANNDVLVGLDIAPTFTNGAFTGVQNIALRVNGTTRLANTVTLGTQPTISAGAYGILTVNSVTGVIEKVDSASVGRPYKTYAAILTQSSTSDPVATVLENTLGGTVVWTRVGVGQYRGTLTGAFSSNKTVLSCVSKFKDSGLQFQNDSNNSVLIATFDTTSVPFTYADTLLIGQSLEVRVYP